MSIKKFKRGENIQLSKNFHLKEAECKCGKCEETLVNIDHVIKLQQLREDLNSSIDISSWYRCPEHNKAVGGEPNSHHMKGNATDITVEGMTPDEVQDACHGFAGMGRYDTFTHVDSRPIGPARWDFRKKNEPKKASVSISDKDI